MATYLVDDLVRLRLGQVESGVELLEQPAHNEVAVALERLHRAGHHLLQLAGAAHNLLAQGFPLLALAERRLRAVGPSRLLLERLVLVLARVSELLLAARRHDLHLAGGRDLLLDGLANVAERLEHLAGVLGARLG